MGSGPAREPSLPALLVPRPRRGPLLAVMHRLGLFRGRYARRPLESLERHREAEAFLIVHRTSVTSTESRVEGGQAVEVAGQLPAWARGQHPVRLPAMAERAAV